MSVSLFRAKDGFEIVGKRDNLTDNNNSVIILKTCVDPNTYSIDAPKGSLIFRTDTGNIYIKTTNLGISNGWEILLRANDLSNEDNYQNEFIGKSVSGNKLPEYTSNNVVLNDDSLLTAISKIDSKIGIIENVENRLYNKLNIENSINKNIEIIDKAIGGDVTSNNYISVNNSINANLSNLDVKLKENSDLLSGLTSGLYWRHKILVISSDNDLKNAVEGTLLSTLLPFSDDDNNILDITDFSSGDYILSVNGAQSKLWKVTSDFKLTLLGFDPLKNGDTFFVQYDLLDNVSSQKNNAIYTFNGDLLVKMSDIDWQFATGIDISSAYSPNSGNVIPGDSVEKAIEKVEGAINSFVELTGIIKGSTNLGDFSNGNIIANNSSIKSALNDLDEDVTKIRNTIGTSIGSSNMGNYSGGLLTQNKSIKENIQELETEILKQGSRFTIIANGSGTITTLKSINLSETDVVSVIWKLTVLNGSTGRYMSTINSLVNSNSTEVDYNEYSILKVGNEPNIKFEVIINSGVLSLIIENNEISSVVVKGIYEII